MINQQEWIINIDQHFQRWGKTGGHIVLFPGYRPDVCMQMANHLGLVFFDFREEEMRKFGQEAGSVGLEQLDSTLYEKVEQKGVVSHNVEALLGVKSRSERRNWLRSFLETDWPNLVVLPIAIYQDDVPEENEAVCDLELIVIPKSTPSQAKLSERLSFHIKEMGRII